MKPDPVEELRDGSDSDEEFTQPIKKGNGRKEIKKPKPSDRSDSDEVLTTQSTKKGKAHPNIILKKPKKGESDSEEKPKPALKNGNGKGKKTLTFREPVKESSYNADSDDKPTKTVKKTVLKKPETIKEPSDDAESEVFDPKKHQRSLNDLSRVDPDFYKFLEKHDSELLHFDENDDELGKEGDETDDEDDEKVHVPGDLHGDSDESDFEAEDAKPIKGAVTLKMVKEWETELQKDGKMKLATFTHVVKLFNAAVKYLGIEQSGKDPQKCKHFVKIKGILVQYLTDVLKLLSAVTSNNILVIMLKHLHQMSKYVACFTRIAKQAIKKLLTLWSGGEETVRVLAFMCILRITRNQQEVLLDIVLKAMFMTYVKNCKFVSPTTWPGINFMRRSLVEMFTLDLDVSYPHVFLYVRQLGIHLRNAIVVPKLEHRLAVYNWQYMNSLHLWAELIQHTVHHNDMKSLHFPLVMIISNTIKLVPTPQYYPVITKFDFNKQHKKASMKPLDFSCILRLSKSQMSESGFKDAVVERLYALLLEYTASISHTISFPDVCVVLIIFLKDFVGNCDIANYKKKLKQLYDKIEESAEFIIKAREVYKVSFIDLKAIRAWEAKRKAEGTPLIKFYENWSKLNKIQKRKNVTKNDELAGVMPLIKRTKISEDAKQHVKINDGTPTTLFPSDSEDDLDLFKKDDAEKEAPPKEKKVKKKQLQKKKNIKQKPELDHSDAADAGDIVKEFSVSDW
ncbi:Nucleolar complex protein 2-like protein [Operophtera brumata]|uniref:Nucleolar complex protein 2-like protein n=1 Tax=Operophtera brumata TaxID=104452 RepID=A0A0L7LJV0_OPEBR|nr:Nucleolar complex protein 2-like protein [Operophtera brumata]